MIKSYGNSGRKAVVSSILDKLIDEEPHKKTEPIESRYQQLAMLYRSVQRDLENLLNMRASELTWPEAWDELNTSLVAYGIPDFMNHAFITEEAQIKFCANLTNIIKRFEPRFKSVYVKLLTNTDKSDRKFRIRIEGLLHAEPMPEPIVFDSVLEPETNQFLITDVSFSP